MKSFAALLAILAIVSGLALGLKSGNTSHPTQAQVETDLVCPTCHEPLDESDSPLAQRMKAFIRSKISAGWSKDRIENALVAQLGPQVLGVPRSSGFDLLAWLLPFATILLGAGALGVGTRAWLKNRTEAEELPQPLLPALEPALDRRIDYELATFDR